MLKVKVSDGIMDEKGSEGTPVMELLQLTYFCDAAVTQNFSHTAKRFCVPPSNISQSIKRLEGELGAELFDRVGNRVQLNSRGEAFFREVEQALTLLRHASDTARGAAQDGTLRLGIRVSRRIAMLAMAAFQSRYPSVGIVAEHGDHAQSSDFDLILSDASFSPPDFIKIKTFREPILLAARRGSVPDKPRLSAQDIMDKPFITMSPNYSMHKLTLEVCRDMGFEPRIALQGEDPVYVRRCVMLGLGVALMPTVSWRGQFSDEVGLYRLGDYTRDVCIYRRASAYPGGYMAEFLHMLVEEFEREFGQI